MNRRIVVQVTAPTVLIGLLLFAACMASVWSINRLQRNLARILSNNVASLVAAQEIEIRLRQLRFHSFVYMMDPRPERRELVRADEQAFENALAQAQAAANDPEEQALVEAIKDGFIRYQAELARAPAKGPETRAEFVEWADRHPVRHLAAPCQELLRINKAAMEQAALESESVSQKAQLAMILLGILGPLSGLISGYGIARGLSRSISRLIVRLQDVRAHLDQDVASVKLAPGEPMRDLDAQLDLVVARVREVAEQTQQHQRDILRAEQLAAVGQLAASVAHEVRNPLTGIKLLVGAALKDQNESLTMDDLQVIHGEIGRMEETVQGLLDFARPPQVQRVPGDLREVVNQAVDLVRSRANQLRVQVRAELPGHAVIASVDRNQLANVLVNMLMNSLDAMPHGGQVELLLSELSGQEIELRVRDSGAGLSPSILDRLFTPFASTKATGTGLGLSICRRIVEGHGGTIVARNRPEGGAEFTIHLPLRVEEDRRAALAGRR
jgi:two-component system sensor histidine kinase HydH